MKRSLVVTLSLMVALSLSACAGGNGQTAPTVATPPHAATAAAAATGASLPPAPLLSGQLPSVNVLPGILPRATALAVPVTPSSVPQCVAFTLTAALFEENSAALRPSAGNDLTSVAEQLETQGGAVAIVGYTDARPTAFPGGNKGLSEARALSVRDALALRGVKNIVRVEGRADQEPVDLGTTEAAYRRNRRVEVTTQCDRPGIAP